MTPGAPGGKWRAYKCSVVTVAGTVGNICSLPFIERPPSQKPDGKWWRELTLYNTVG